MRLCGEDAIGRPDWVVVPSFSEKVRHAVGRNYDQAYRRACPCRTTAPFCQIPGRSTWLVCPPVRRTPSPPRKPHVAKPIALFA